MRQLAYHFQYFNPRSHERSDNSKPLTDLNNANFNPRSHERSDFEAVLKDEFSIISIHAPTRGATIYGYLIRAIDD